MKINALKSKKGFTLVEVIVSLLIVSIILAFATSFFFVGQKLFSNSIKNSNNKIVGDNVLSFLSEKLKYADKIQILNNSSVSSAKYTGIFYMTNNMLGFDKASSKNNNIYGESYYNGNRLRVTVTVLDKTSMNISVSVISSSLTEVLYSTNNVIKILNLNLTSSEIEIDSSLINKPLINPIISFSSKAV